MSKNYILNGLATDDTSEVPQHLALLLAERPAVNLVVLCRLKNIRKIVSATSLN